MVRITLTVDGLDDRDGQLEYGLQDRAGALEPGTALADGAVRYTTEVGTRPRPDGTVSYSGDHVHGPARERFLYLSFRPPGGTEWTRRLKVPLPERLGESVVELVGRVTDLGTTRGRFHDDGWTRREGE
ncbi:hypothetical protein A4R44_05807 [Amycolatopsis sp. M39]|nr:hypothetical protein A4R44_05807 [Amycolatopsis sp. M39]SFQ68879.1 hypothetical protein SAMN05421854_11986 [Amycolatopsis rubida]